MTSKANASPKSRPTYSQNWPAYNAAQSAEYRLFNNLLTDLVEEVEEPLRQGAGRPSILLREQAFCAIQKVYSQMSCRRSHGLILDAADRGQVRHAPHYNTSSKFLNRAETTGILHDLVRTTAAPLAGLETDFAVDSTGFRTRCFGAYCEEKHGEAKEHNWIKAHICTGIRTHVVTEVILTGSEGKGSGDGPNMLPLVQGTQQTGFQIQNVLGDKAYSSKANHEGAGDLGATAWIPFKSNAVNHAKGERVSRRWKKAFHFFQLNRDQFDAIYHKRSNVESTIAAIKKKFGDNLKSKNGAARFNELLCKIIAYNITILIHEMHENGIAPDFSGTRPRKPQ